jgi:hypothetical protein
VELIEGCLVGAFEVVRVGAHLCGKPDHLKFGSALGG